MKRQEERVDKHLLGPLTQAYSTAARAWCEANSDQINSHIDPLGNNPGTYALKDAFETIQWFMYQIHVKTKRALHGLFDEDDDVWDNEIQTDANGSAKVALLGIERSAEAFQTIVDGLPELSPTTLPLIGRLKALVTHIEQEFPNARKFVRVGFDTGD